MSSDVVDMSSDVVDMSSDVVDMSSDIYGGHIPYGRSQCPDSEGPQT